MNKDVKTMLFDSYLSGMRRGRGILLTIVLLSCLIIAVGYLDIWGYQKEALEGIYGNRYLHKTPEDSTMHHLMRDMASFKSIIDFCIDSTTTRQSNNFGLIQEKYVIDSLNDLCRIYEDSIKYVSEKLYTKMMTDNTLKSEKSGSQELPLLGMQVPKNDYPIILGVMLTVFSIILCLNSLSVLDNINELRRRYKDDLNLPTLILSSFSFTGIGGKNLKIRKTCEFTVYFLPVAALSWMGFVIFYVEWNLVTADNHFYMGEAILPRMILLLLSIFICLLMAAIVTRNSRKTDDLLNQWNNGE